MRLSDLQEGETGVITEITDKQLEPKLLEMGCLPNEKITVEKISLLGDPIAYLILEYKLGLRRSEADAILVQKV